MKAGWLCTTGRGLFVERRFNSATFVRAIPTKAKPDMRLDLNSPFARSRIVQNPEALSQPELEQACLGRPAP
jgi:hypothetical protein